MTLIRDEPAPPGKVTFITLNTLVKQTKNLFFIHQMVCPTATPRFIPPAPSPPQKRVITEEMMSKQIPSIVQSAPTPKQISLEEEETVEEQVSIGPVTVIYNFIIDNFFSLPLFFA